MQKEVVTRREFLFVGMALLVFQAIHRKTFAAKNLISPNHQISNSIKPEIDSEQTKFYFQKFIDDGGNLYSGLGDPGKATLEDIWEEFEVILKRKYKLKKIVN